MEKQRDKAARRLQRKLERQSPGGGAPIDGAEDIPGVEGTDGAEDIPRVESTDGTENPASAGGGSPQPDDPTL